MKLSEFLEETIYEIALGIHAAKVKSRNLVAVSPGEMDKESVIEKSYIDFDVSLVVTDGTTTSGGGKGGASASIQVGSLARAGLSAEAEGRSEKKSDLEQTHRVSFRVPVYFNAHHRADATMSTEIEIIEKEKQGR